MTKKPVTEVVLVGTKEDLPRSPSSSEEEPPAAATASGGVWDRLAQCESGGNWSINTGNGYYGGLQFSLEHLARVRRERATRTRTAKSQQIAVAKRLQAAAGWGQWPACSRKLGLR